jgi:nitroreductase
MARPFYWENDAMNHLVGFLNSHVSVRQFTGQDITEEDERLIVTTAQRSPTSSNLQAYTIIGIRSQPTKGTLAELCGNQAHIAQSSLFFVFCADLNRLAKINEAKEYRFTGEYTELCLVATVDTALVAGRALMAAQALGLGGVMVGAIRNNPAKITELLGLPSFTYAVMGMSLGYPKSVPQVKPRLPIDAVYCREHYNAEKFEEAVSEYDDTIIEGGHLKGREVKNDEYPNYEGKYSWSEHSARRLADMSPTALRPHMKSYLESQGFLQK